MTRDRVTYDATWRGRAFTLVDTGGWEPEVEGTPALAARVAAQARVAVDAADAVLFVVDAVVGRDRRRRGGGRRAAPVPQAGRAGGQQGRRRAGRVQRQLAVVARPGRAASRSARCTAGAAATCSTRCSTRCRRRPAERLDAEGGPRRVALIGRPNVGKSSLLNKLAGQERVLVDSVAGTTRDPVDELIELGGKTWRFVDTAGIRRRMRETQGADYFAALRTERALERAEVAVVLVDASEPLAEQDLRIVSMVIEAGPGAGHRLQQVGPGRRGPPALPGPGDRPAAAHRPLGAAGQHLGHDRLARGPARARAGDRRWRAGRPGCRPGRLNAWLTALIAADAAAGARRQAAEDHVRHPGRDQAAALRAVHRRASCRRATAGSSSAGCARSSASTAPRCTSSMRLREKRSGRPPGRAPALS